MSYGLYNTAPVIRTFTGLWMNVFKPTEDMIHITDIAHALSHLCRFGGHTKHFYSVAQHSVNCCSLVDKEYRLSALLHDASEAYLLDIPTPIKRKLSDYKEIEEKLMKVIAAKFGFTYPFHAEIKYADKKMLEIEWESFMLKRPISIYAQSSLQAKQHFLETFKQLTT